MTFIMVFINVCLFQKTILHLISHYSFTPSCTSSILNHKTQSSFFFSSFKHYLYIAAQPHLPLIFSPLALFLFVSQATLAFVFFCPPLILCLHWMVHEWTGAAVFLTRLIGLIFYLEQGSMLHYTYIDLQLLCKSRHWHRTVKFIHGLLLFQ